MDEKIRKTKLGRWLKENAPDVLDTVGDLLPDAGGLGVVKRLLGSKADSPEVSQMMQELQLARLEAVSSRWASDMASDSRLSKNIRPMALISLLCTLFLMMSLDSVEGLPFEVKEQYIDLLQALSMTAFGAYFAGRSYEKTRKND
tara:strand:- start:90 stop:524 length:435 start_codon:yes stop_codon:yes gene_type:complete